MRRVTVIVVVYVLLVGGAAVVAYRTGGEPVRKVGRGLYPHRWVVNLLRAVDNTETPDPTSAEDAAMQGYLDRLGLRGRTPDVVWAGDSTLQEVARFPSYVGMIQRETLRPAHVTSLALAAPGMDFYAYWSVAGRIAALHPKVVIVIANLRTFEPEGTVRSLSDLTAEIDAADLPETLALPFYVRHMTAPRLLVARTLRTELGENLFFTFEGLRRDAQDAEAWNALGPAKRTPATEELVQRVIRVNEGLLAAFDRPIGPDGPLVRFAGATVARLVRGGATVLVVVTPMPWERAMEAGHYEQGRFERRIDVLRGVVEASGGRLIDLHRSLLRRHFRDGDCHFTAEGAAEMARLLAPEVLAGLAADGSIRVRVP